MLGIANGTLGSSSSYGQNSSWNIANGYSGGWNSTLGTGAIMSALSQENARQANEWAKENMREAMAYNSKEAQKARDWEEMMSNSAYTRAVADMKKAGINPILAAGSQASTPTAGIASVNALQAQMAREYTDSESRNWSENQSKGGSSGYNTSESSYESNIAEQIKSGINAIADAMGSWFSDDNSGKGADEKEEGMKEIMEKSYNEMNADEKKAFVEYQEKMYGIKGAWEAVKNFPQNYKKVMEKIKDIREGAYK